jgi:hypothetical protein
MKIVIPTWHVNEDHWLKLDSGSLAQEVMFVSLFHLGGQHLCPSPVLSPSVVILIHTCKHGLSLNPFSVSSEAQCLSSSPLTPRLKLLPSKLTPMEAKGGRP